MKTLLACGLALFAFTGVARADGLSISLSMKDSRATVGPRHDVREARLAITSRDGSTALMLLDDVVAVELTNRALAQMKSDEKTSTEHGFLEEILTAMVVGGVRFAAGKSIEYPIADIGTADYRNGELRLTNDQNQLLFEELKVNNVEVLRNFSKDDATRFINALRAAKASRK